MRLLAVETHDTRCGDRRSEHAAHRRRMPAAIPLDTEPQPIGDIDSDGERGQELLATHAAHTFRGGERRRKHHGISMHIPTLMRVVEVECMRDESVTQCRIRRRDFRVAAKQRRLPAPAPICQLIQDLVATGRIHAGDH